MVLALPRKYQSLPSLRVGLQSAALLSVIAGYVLLFVINAGLADAQRRDNHQRFATSLLLQLRSTTPPALPLENQTLQIRLHSQGPELLPQQQSLAGGEQWLVSRRRVSRVQGDWQWLELRQNITHSLAHERFSQLLLLAVAGGSILLTFVLLRLVLRRGLLLPLQELDRQFQALDADNLGDHLLDQDHLPHELRPIALAFNHLQQRLAVAWKLESSFVDGVAHALRTPITLMSGHAQRLQRHPLPLELQRPISVMASEAKRMGLMITMLRDLSRANAGRLDLHLEPLDVDQQLLIAYERLAFVADGRLLFPSPASESPSTLIGDYCLLQDCLDALVSNALLDSEGPVSLEASIEEDWIVLHVLDSGNGMSSSERSLELQRFRSGTSSSRLRGSGIGLSLVDALLKAMDGNLQIADVPDGGADCQMRLRRSCSPPSP
ncbi:two-component sensor histidine kinase domain protein [Synechococcus sp. SYN20]|uniref:sensor histidine kinase n=1 Tax=Synechococcus sp. SYN20 TaxID=1050714 RepID=UPI0016475EEE|nr:HAMP domain-containing sensor histidine kinase [Synechococcus sp. SYN20]QNJ25113.1 two-component sensor histidine kinase domain protein [Synechococcus sp. SYN20]